MIAERIEAPRAVDVETAPRPRRIAERLLATDFRFELFAVLFALGTIHHELQFMLEQQITGPFTGYLERSALLRPTVPWPSSVGIAVHVADVVLAVLILVLPWRRLLMVLLAACFLPSYLTSPERIPSHNSLMLFGLVLVLIFGVVELLGRARLTPRSFRATDWCGWTLTGLAWICALTYWFASFHKLNTRFFRTGSSPVQAFIEPYAELFRIPTDLAVNLLAFPLSVATVSAEIALPLLLWYRPTRLVGCLIGVIFHLVMMGQGVLDFPTLILAFYPAFLSVGECRALVAACLARPSWQRLAVTLVFGAIGAVSISLSVQLGELTGRRSGADVLMVTQSALLYLGTLLFVHVAATLVVMLWRRRRASLPNAAPAL